MANNYENDAVANWTFDGQGSALFADGIGGNDISIDTQYHTGVPSDATQNRDGADKRVGESSMRIDMPSLGADALSRVLRRQDSLLSSDFPTKNATSNNKFTIACWTKFDFEDPQARGYNWTASIRKESFWYFGGPDVPDVQWKLEWSYVSSTDNAVVTFSVWDSGSVRSFILSAAEPKSEKWYHITATYDGDTGEATLQMYDFDAGALLAPIKTGTLTTDPLINASNFSVHCQSRGSGNIAVSQFVGKMFWDDLVVFERVLSETEISDIVLGIFGPFVPDDLISFPPERPDDYNPDFSWQPDSWAGDVYTPSVWGSDFVTAGGGRWGQQFVAIGKDLVFYEELT